MRSAVAGAAVVGSYHLPEEHHVSHRSSSVKLLALVVSMSIAVGVAPAFAAVSPPERRQNTAIKKNTVKNKKQQRAIRKLNAAAKSAGLAIGTLTAGVTKAQTTADGANSKADTILAQAPAIFDALTKLKDGLTAAGAGLTAINAALQDPVTGLVGLNNARPKFAVISGTAVAGSTPGFVGVTRVTTGLYILGFGQDVSKRAPQLSLNTPGVPVTGATPIGQILNCGGSDASKTACENVLAGAGTSSPENKALVTIQNATSGTAADYTFTATEIAG